MIGENIPPKSVKKNITSKSKSIAASFQVCRRSLPCVMLGYFRANVLVNNPNLRTQLYQEAEEILVRDVGGVFLWHTIINEMWRPYVRGVALEKNNWGYKAWRGNQMLNLMPTLYMSQEVVDNTSKQEADSFWDWLVPK